MDFFNRQDRLKTQSRLFFSAFFPALILAVIAIYFAVTFGIMSAATVSYWLLEANEANPGLLAPYLLSGADGTQYPLFMPAFIYGDSPRILSARSIALVGGGVLAVILLATFGKCRAIRRGGGAYIAKKLGGAPIAAETRVPAEKKLINIAAEMALASGLPLPALYVLPRENTINAVTAGLDHNDAVIAVTQGALDHLTRDELQGVLAHEYAHILNADCALNMIMAGWLHGLLLFTAAGKTLCSAVSSCWAEVKDLDLRWRLLVTLLILPPGLLLRAAGSLGHLTASIIEAAFSRSREHLADAFAVQFTRNPGGLAGALKKIGGAPRRANIHSGQALAMKSFFIASPNPRRNGGLLSSHPPLRSRILALDPKWDGEFVRPVPGQSGGWRNLSARPAPSPDRPRRSRPEHWLTAALAALRAEARAADGPTKEYAQLAGDSLEETADFQAALPEKLREAMTNPGGAEVLVYALFCDSRPEVRDGQMSLIGRAAGQAAAEAAAALRPLATRKARLPLLDLLNPALRKLPDETRRRLAQVVDGLIAADGRVDIFEIAGLIILKNSLRLPARRRRTEVAAGADDFARDAATVLTGLAHLGQAGRQGAEAAFQAALARCPDLLAPRGPAAREAVTSGDLIQALERLGRAPLKTRESLLRAALTCGLHDGRIAAGEYELLAALAAALSLPLPWPSLMSE